MNRYGEYKKIEAQWLGTIPSHWGSPQLREILKERKEKVSDKEFSPLSVCKAGIVPQLSTAAKSNAGDNRKAVRKGDFVINSRSDRRGSSGISKYEGSVSLISHVLSPRGDVADNFLHYLLRSHNFIEEFYRNGRGIVADLWTTRFDEMKTITLPFLDALEADTPAKQAQALASLLSEAAYASSDSEKERFGLTIGNALLLALEGAQHMQSASQPAYNKATVDTPPWVQTYQQQSAQFSSELQRLMRERQELQRQREEQQRAETLRLQQKLEALRQQITFLRHK